MVISRKRLIMFTGIVQKTGVISSVIHQNDITTLVVSDGFYDLTTKELGNSFSVDGVCLTLVSFYGSEMHFELVQSTLDKSYLSKIAKGSLVNLERSSLVGDSHGGHDISGHVDFTALVHQSHDVGRSKLIIFKIPEGKIDYFIDQGFISINGCSITIDQVLRSERLISVWLIPETLERTNLRFLETGSMANIEIDKVSQQLVDSIQRSISRVDQKVCANPSLVGAKIAQAAMRVLSNKQHLTEGVSTVPKKIAIVCAAYHDAVKEMLEIVTRGISSGEDFQVLGPIVVPGAWEIPLAVQRVIGREDVIGVITLGAIEKGETGHGVAMARGIYVSLQETSLKFNKPVSLGIIGPGATVEQIDARAESVANEALEGIFQMINLES